MTTETVKKWAKFLRKQQISGANYCKIIHSSNKNFQGTSETSKRSFISTSSNHMLYL